MKSKLIILKLAIAIDRIWKKKRDREAFIKAVTLEDYARRVGEFEKRT